jgi:hypothetical protein
MNWLWPTILGVIMAALGGGAFLAIQRPGFLAGLVGIAAKKAWAMAWPYLLYAFTASPETIERSKKEAREGLEPGEGRAGKPARGRGKNG